MTCSELFPPTETNPLTSIASNWTKLPNVDGRGDRLPYKYYDDAEPVLAGALGRYEGNGYMIDYNLSSPYPETTYKTMLADLTWLNESGWLDMQYTRSVIVSFTVYNIHYDLWQSVDFLFEMPPNGGEMWQFANIIPFRPGLNETPAEIFIHKMDYVRIVLALLLLVIMQTEIAHKVKNQKAGVRLFSPPGASQQTADAIMDTKVGYDSSGQFRSWTATANMYNEVIILEGVLFFLTMWRMLSFIRLSRHIYLYWRFLGKAMGELAFLSILLVPAFCGFVMMTSNIFANYVRGYDNGAETVMTLLAAVKGDFDLELMFGHDRLWTVLFCTVFFFVIPFLLMNTFIVIMIDAYYTIQLTEGGDPREYRWDRYRWMRWCLPNLVINNLPSWLSDRMSPGKQEGMKK